MNCGTTACTTHPAKPPRQSCRIWFWWGTGMKHNSNSSFILRVSTSALLQVSAKAVVMQWPGSGMLGMEGGQQLLQRWNLWMKCWDTHWVPAQVMTELWTFQQYLCVWHQLRITRKTIQVVCWVFFSSLNTSTSSSKPKTSEYFVSLKITPLYQLKPSNLKANP